MFQIVHFFWINELLNNNGIITIIESTRKTRIYAKNIEINILSLNQVAISSQTLVYDIYRISTSKKMSVCDCV